ncbi:MAG TPA: DNA-binding response regulator [Spirochaetaceae bacterium]|jgi:two-component system response regulator YesN|nr:DNA-binding response regulator [Spirochaetaceae bacterium]
MYGVLIVDDEEPVLDSFAYMLETRRADFALVGKARSGYEAIQLIHELRPDLVFMDINIPGMDGIEVIADVHLKFPGTVFILSTAYERFDLAQRAIPLGIFAYLVKPVSKKTFLSTLDAAQAALDKRDPPLTERAGDLAERQFLKETIWKEMGVAEWERCRELFSLHSDKGIVCLIELESGQARWCAEIAAKLAFRHRCLFTLHLNRGLYLIPEDVDRDALLALLGELIKDTVPESLFSAYAAGRVHQGTELFLSGSEALEDLKRKKNSADLQVRERLRIIQLRRMMRISALEELRKLFITLWEEIFASYGFIVAKAKMAAIFTLLLDDAAGCYSGHSEIELPFAPAEEIMPIANLADWADWSLQAFNTVHALVAARRSGQFPLPLVKAVEFINEHYAEQLQLSSAAEAASVSTAYLSRLFSEHLCTSFVEYLTELRVEEAERLIRESRMSIKQIAFSVGYQDPNYFGKIFRKATGLPPTMYAAANRAEALGSSEKDGL